MRLKGIIVFALVPALLYLSGCIKQVDPNPIIAEAKRMMESAKSERADTYAPVNLDLAAKNLARAEVELSKGDRKRAYEWARRSQADAELAVKISKGARLEDETKKMSAVAETKEGE